MYKDGIIEAIHWLRAGTFRVVSVLKLIWEFWPPLQRKNYLGLTYYRNLSMRWYYKPLVVTSVFQSSCSVKSYPTWSCTTLKAFPTISIISPRPKLWFFMAGSGFLGDHGLIFNYQERFHRSNLSEPRLGQTMWSTWDPRYHMELLNYTFSLLVGHATSQCSSPKRRNLEFDIP